MVQIILPHQIEQQLVKALSKARMREIGGILMGEHVAEDTFRVVDLTVQGQRGTVAAFLRALTDALAALKKFFGATGHNYRRFNYLGEWHSHPSFALEPSLRDCETMWELVNDPEVGAGFAVLMIVKLDRNAFDGRAWVFMPERELCAAKLVQEGESQ